MKLLLFAFIILVSSPAFSRTESELRRVISQNPQNLRAYSELIELATTREQILQIGNTALKAIGPRTQLHTAMGNAYMNVNDYNNAVTSYRMAVALNPKSSTSYNRLGMALLRIGYYRQAEVAFKSALAYTPVSNRNSRLFYLTNLGTTYEHLKEFDEAKKIVRTLLALNNRYQPALDLQKRLPQS